MRLKEIDYGVVSVDDILANLCLMPALQAGFALLDSSEFDGQNDTSYICIRPQHTYEMRGNDVYIDDQFIGSGKALLYQEMRKLLNQYDYTKDDSKGFVGGFVGYISYEATPLFLDLPIQVAEATPCIMFRFYRQVLKITNNQGTLLLLEDTDAVFSEWAQLGQRQGCEKQDSPLFSDQMQSEAQYSQSLLKQGFIDGVKKTQAAIEKGDVYQLNLTRRLQRKLKGDEKAFLLDYYRRIRKRNKAPYGLLWGGEKMQFASSSPEQFFQLRRGLITTKPIKGTRPRKNDLASDARMRAELAASTKDHAELLMITDLLRNDLNRVVENGTVVVEKFAEVCENPTVFHLVSTIQAKLPPTKDALDVLDCLFPGGSITGAPKKAAVAMIDQLETVPRGLYTGSAGYFSVNGDADFNILIRTLFQKHDTIEVHVGGGIVYESVPHLEYLETQQKAKALLAVIEEVEQ